MGRGYFGKPGPATAARFSRYLSCHRYRRNQPARWLAVDELPPAVQSDMGKVSYKAEIQGKVLRYTRQMQVNDVLISVPQLPELRHLYSQIAADEKATAVLKRQ